MNAAVFLDRDGTLIHQMADPADPGCVELIRGAAAAVASICGLGYKVVVVTNQPAVARGQCTLSQVDAIHQQINDAIQRSTGATIDRFYFCPHDPKGTIDQYKSDHPWRKPKPGMLKHAAQEMGLDIDQSWMIGDSEADVQAGAAVGVRTVLLTDQADAVHAAGGQHGGKKCNPDYVAPNLIEAVKAVAQQRRPEVFEHTHDLADGLAAPTRRATETMDEPVSQRRREAVPTTAAPGKPPRAQPSGRLDPEIPVPASLATPAPDKPSQSADDTAVHQVLRQILQELRSQRSAERDFSFASAVAVVLQIVTVACVLGALFLGGTGHIESFHHWMGCAIVAQLATIAAMLFDRR